MPLETQSVYGREYYYDDDFFSFLLKVSELCSV